MTRGRFVVSAVSELPEARDVVADHLDEQDGQVLLHLLVADLRRLVLKAWTGNDVDFQQRCLAFLGSALSTGDDQVANAVAVSFVEDIGWWEAGVQALSTPGLRH